MNIIKVENLVKVYEVNKKEEGVKGSVKGLFKPVKEKKTAVDNVSFTIEEGKIIGLIGPNGAGKTTTLKMLSGLIYPTSGKVEVMNMLPWKRKKEFKRNLTFILGQKQQLWWDLPAIESFNLNKEIYQLDDEEYTRFMNELVDLLDVRHVLNTPVRNLSLGERMKMEIIAGLLHKPKLIFLDEPTIGLDTISQKRIIEFFEGYNKKYAATIILTSHYMKDIEMLCQDIIIINKGSIIYNGALSDIKKYLSQKKTITVAFSKEIKEQEVDDFGGVVQENGYSAIFSIDKTNIMEFIGNVMSKLPIEDINITDEPLEEIVERLLNK